MAPPCRQGQSGGGHTSAGSLPWTQPSRGGSGPEGSPLPSPQTAEAAWHAPRQAPKQQRQPGMPHAKRPNSRGSLETPSWAEAAMAQSLTNGPSRVLLFARRAVCGGRAQMLAFSCVTVFSGSNQIGVLDRSARVKWLARASHRDGRPGSGLRPEPAPATAAAASGSFEGGAGECMGRVRAGRRRLSVFFPPTLVSCGALYLLRLLWLGGGARERARAAFASDWLEEGGARLRRN